MATTEPSVAPSALEGFARGLRGSLLRTGDAGYDEARRVHNGMHDREPELIVRCAGPADVIAAVKYARSEGLDVAIKGGGHSVPGYSSIAGGMLIDLSAMRSVRVDPEARTARAEAGCLWEDLDHETQAFGLAVTGGQVSHTGIAGLTLGGGFGYLVRKYGFTVDSLLSVDLVTADGALVHASEAENPELFWGVRGGGGNFGIVTSFEYRLHPVGPIVTGGMMLWPGTAARDLLRFWADYMVQAREELTTQFAFIHLPPAPFVPEDAWGAAAVGMLTCYAGSPEQSAPVLAPFREFRTPIADMVGPIPYVALQQMINELVPHGNLYYSTGNYLTEISDEAADAMVSIAHSAPSPMSFLGIFSLGGAAGRVAEDATAMGTRNARFSAEVISIWVDPAETEANIDWARQVGAAVRPFGTGSAYVNLMGEPGADVSSFYSSATRQRLAELKAAYDPTNFFNRNANVAPAP
jgi:hypothetical protein